MVKEDYEVLKKVYEDILQTQVLSEKQVEEIKALLAKLDTLLVNSDEINTNLQKVDEIVTKLNQITTKNDDEVIKNFNDLAKQKIDEVEKEYKKHINTMFKEIDDKAKNNIVFLDEIAETADKIQLLIDKQIVNKFKRIEKIVENYVEEATEVGAELLDDIDNLKKLKAWYKGQNLLAGIGIGFAIGVIATIFYLKSNFNVAYSLVSKLNPTVIQTKDGKYLKLNKDNLIKDNNNYYVIYNK